MPVASVYSLDEILELFVGIAHRVEPVSSLPALHTALSLCLLCHSLDKILELFADIAHRVEPASSLPALHTALSL